MTVLEPGLRRTRFIGAAAARPPCWQSLLHLWRLRSGLLRCRVPRSVVSSRRWRCSGGDMPTGVTVARGGRTFVNFPRWDDPVRYTVAELKDGRPVPYPTARIYRLNRARPRSTFVSVQSVVVDPRNRLWVLDTGSINFGRRCPAGRSSWRSTFATGSCGARRTAPTRRSSRIAARCGPTRCRSAGAGARLRARAKGWAGPRRR